MHRSSSSSRTALTTVGRMPVISEDDSIAAFTRRSLATLPPPPPCRSATRKSYGRLPVSRPLYAYPSGPPPAYSRSASQDSSKSARSTRSLRSVRSNGSNPSSGTSTPRSSYKETANLLPSTTPASQDTPEEKRRGSTGIARRRGWYRLFILAVVAVGLTVGLSVGLTVGNHKSSQPAAFTGASNSTDMFPSGSFAFNTALLEASTDCTSDPSTWRCFPDQTYSQSPNASVATFFWTISQRNSYTYQISSSSNATSQPFVNEPMTLVEGNSYDERLVFNFSLPKTVAPSDNVTQDGRAATCTYPVTTFRATLWTRRNATTTLAQSGGTTAPPGSAQGNVKWRVWPGQVEIVQVGTGAPQCKDHAGNAVSVAAGNDQCNCLYANFDFEVQEKRRTRRQVWGRRGRHIRNVRDAA